MLTYVVGKSGAGKTRAMLSKLRNLKEGEKAIYVGESDVGKMEGLEELLKDKDVELYTAKGEDSFDLGLFLGHIFDEDSNITFIHDEMVEGHGSKCKYDMVLFDSPHIKDALDEYYGIWVSLIENTDINVYITDQVNNIVKEVKEFSEEIDFVYHIKRNGNVVREEYLRNDDGVTKVEEKEFNVEDLKNFNIV